MKKFFLVMVIVLLVILSTFSSQAQSEDEILRVCPNNVESLAWSPTGNKFAIQGFVGTRVYDKELEPIAYLNEDYFQVLMNGGKPYDEYSSNCWGAGVAWSQDEQLIAAPFHSAEGMWIKIWEVETAQVVAYIPHSASMMLDIKWNTAKNRIAASLRGYAGGWWIMTRNVEDYSHVTGREFGYSDNPNNVLDWNPTESKWLASGLDNGQINIWDTDATHIGLTGEEDLIKEFLIAYEAHQGAVNDLAWNPSGNWIASAGDDGNIFIWDFEEKIPVKTIVGSIGAIKTLDWNSTGTLIASAGRDATIHIWNVETGEEIATLSGHEETIYALDWNSDDSLILTASRDNTVRIWDVSDLGQ